MPPRQKSLTRGRWSSIALSVLLHSLIVAVAVFAWKFWKRTPEPPQTLAIEATVVDASALKGASTKPPPPEPPPPEPVPEPQPEPEPETPPEEQGPPKPDPAEIERREQQEREKVEQQKREQEEKAAQELKVKEEAERVEQQKQAAAKAAAEKKAAADKAAAEKKRADDAAAKKKADELAAKKAADDKARQARESELRRSLEAEERGRALQNSDEANRWHAAIVARITRAWIRPPSAQPGIECIVSVTQVPGGEVTAVKVISCNGGDAALRDSVEAAVLRASPLPAPPDPALFERNLELTFAPT
ncbi:MAG TPA: cell envelope integrity protein TolA [Steroidobacteraceae bacterium]|nr:cell envelope integrity protein TolA [Steroidobacteraceae bacterium]